METVLLAENLYKTFSNKEEVLKGIDFKIERGSFSVILGQSGSGKSTLLNVLSGMLKPTSGTVTIGDRVITAETNNKNLKPIRQKVGIVFQFPEAQLFEETVERDIAFGPKNFGVPEEEANRLAAKTLEMVGLDESYLQRSPFDLSGGQMRRVAIAGVLAMEPEVLVLDEPTAGLDPQGRKEMMEMFARLHHENKITIVLVTHLMDDVADFSDYVYVLEKGTLVKQGTPREVFQEVEWLQAKQLGVPTATAFAQKLVTRGIHFDSLPLTSKELAEMLIAKGGLPYDE